MKMHRIAAALCVVALAGAGCRAALPRQEMQFGGQAREYYLIEPPGKARAIVFALHGGSGTALHMLKLVPDLKDIAARHSALVVLPQGIGKSWNDGRTDPISAAHKDKLPDSEFLTALATQLKTAHSIPDGQVFTMGISNGGMMSLRLVCDSRYFRRSSRHRCPDAD
jgi:polyhydroxybutyrate depolymerase